MSGPGQLEKVGMWGAHGSQWAAEVRYRKSYEALAGVGAEDADLKDRRKTGFSLSLC